MKQAKRYIIIIILITIVVRIESFGQQTEIIPRSPNTAMLERFGEYPISYYTGTVPINVNLYSLPLSKDFTLNIQLLYHSGGIRVDDVNSWVGTGWSLYAGGCISRDVRGIPDDDSQYGFYKNTQNITISEINLMSWEQINALHAYESFPRMDLEPDLFRMNLNGRSISFFLDKDRNFRTIPHADIKINKHPLDTYNRPEVSDDNIWEIIDESGTKFIFKTKEGQIEQIGVRRATTAWMLHQIVSSEGQILVSFSYQNYRRKNPKTEARTETLTHLLKEYGMGENFNNLKWKILGHKVINSSNELSFQCQLLTGISLYNGYSLQLKEGNAIDDGTGFSVLESISLYNDKKENLFSYKLNYIGKNERDYLDNIVKYFNNQTIKLRQFKYNDYLPLRNSTSIDYWGYYNGIHNNNLLMFNKDIYNIQSYNYADRNPTEKATTGLIKEIHYPTGGYTEFGFEVNKAYFPPDSYVETGTCSTSVYSPDEFIPNGQNERYPMQTEIKKIHNKSIGSGNSQQKITLSIEKLANKSLVVDVKIKQVKTGNIVFKINGRDLYSKQYDHFMISSDDDGNASYYITENINLETGEDYELIMNTTKYNDLTPFIISVFTCYYNCSSTITKPGGYKPSGGTRISYIKNIGSDKQLLDYTIYTYASPRIAIQPSFVRDYGLRICSSSSSSSPGPMDTYYIKVRELGSTDLNRHSGSFNQFPRVTEKKIDVNQNDTLTTEYYYSTFSFERFPQGSMTGGYDIPMLPYSINEYEGGLLESKTDYITYNKKNIPIKTESHIYTKVGTPNIAEAIMIHPKYNKGLCISGSFNQNVTDEYDWGHYTYTSEKQVIKKTTEKLFFYDSEYEKVTSTITTNKDYTYKDNGYIQPVSITRTSSDKKTVLTENKYPYDQSDAVYKSMVSNNILTPVIENKVSVAGNTVSLTKTPYSVFNGTMYLPSEIQTSNGSGSLKTQITFNQYDKIRGYLSQLTTKEGIAKTYLWSYGGQYPVAEIVNASYEDVKKQLGVTPESISELDSPDMSKINALREKLPNAQITTYTYKPLVGMLTSTDPRGVTTYYDYDDFGRLKEVYIKETPTSPKRVIESYDYKYANQ